MLETPLARLFEVTREILEADDPDQALHEIAAAVRDLFGFRCVTIVAAEDASAPLQRRVMLGWSEEIVRTRLGERIGREEIRSFLRPEFEVFEGCYFVPAESIPHWPYAIYLDENPTQTPRASPEQWHDEDSLTLVLRERGGGMLGYMSVDGPPNGTIPPRETLRSMQLFVNLVGLALANARAQARLRYEATHDGLTRLPNRQFFAEQLQEALRERSSVHKSDAVVFVDLDEFKSINDTLGHLAGDRVLLTVAQRLWAATTEGDVVARLGGDEFAVLLRDRDGLAAIDETVDDILGALIQPIPYETVKVFTSASVGIAMIEPRHVAIADILREADTAMYAAKSTGRARKATFDAEMQSQSARRRTLINALREALDGNHFTIEYQPIVTLSDRRWVALEALVRWDHQELGLIEPTEFIPLAEEVGIVVPIGRFVLEEACRRFSEWNVASQNPLGLHVNLTVQEVLQPDVVAFIEGLLRAHAIDPKSLTVEITEHAILRSSKYADAALIGLRKLGVRLCIDDFGTGYSSLRYLQEFPIDALKIDRSFIDGPRGALGSEPIVKVLTELAASYKVEAIAEGVRDERQSAALRRIGCGLAQGRLFAPPLAPAQISEALRATQPAVERPRARRA